MKNKIKLANKTEKERVLKKEPCEEVGEDEQKKSYKYYKWLNLYFSYKNNHSIPKCSLSKFDCRAIL